MTSPDPMKRLAELLVERGYAFMKPQVPCGHSDCVWACVRERFRASPPSTHRDAFESVIARLHGPRLTEDEWSALDREMGAYIEAQIALYRPTACA